MPVTFYVKLDDQGRVTIPKSIRDLYSLKPKDKVKLTLEEKVVTLA